MPLFNRLDIARRLLIIGCLALSGMIVMAAIYLRQSALETNFRQSEEQLVEAGQAIAAVEASLRTAGLTSERFNARPSEELAEALRAALLTTTPDLAKASASLGGHGIAGTSETEVAIKRYAESFARLVEVTRELGFSADSGLRGAMQSAVNKVETLTVDVENAELRASMLALRKHEKDFMLWGDNAYVDQFKAELPNFKQHLKATYPPGAQRMKVAQALDMYVVAFDLFSKGRLQAQAAQGEVSAAADAAETQVAALASGLATHLAEAKAAIVSLRADNETLAMRVVGTAALLLLMSIWLVGRSITRPVKAITAAMQSLAAGDTQQSISHLAQPNELGQMVLALEVFRQSAIDRARLEAEAEEARQEAQRERIRMQADAEERARQRLEQATGGLANGLKQLAAGDLTVSLDQNFSPEFEGLRGDLNDTVQQLRDLLQAINATSLAIDGGSRQISTEAAALSERTVRQAAALEETAAALGQIADTVSQSASLCVEARNAARTVNGSMEQTGTLVSAAIDAMERIEQSSRSIASIIGVIDEIAFQTNLLALNAGVEAARAGEAGKGFAVVAHEVRELAQRSANAAKEIKALISKSGDEVADGARYVRDTGKALSAIETDVLTIGNHMEGIAAGAAEQSAAIAEVNSAVAGLDLVTQQNASLVERNQEAARALEQEAAQLGGLVANFRLSVESAKDGSRSQYGRVA